MGRGDLPSDNKRRSVNFENVLPGGWVSHGTSWGWGTWTGPSKEVEGAEGRGTAAEAEGTKGTDYPSLEAVGRNPGE